MNRTAALPIRIAPAHADAASLPAWTIALLTAAYALFGLLGHDPWKADEAYIFGTVFEILQGGDWVVPSVAGIPFVEKPPLLALVGALFAKAFSPALALHDAARLSCALFLGTTVACVYGSSRMLWGRGADAAGALLLLGSLGLFANSHLMMADLPLMAGYAIATLGLAGCALGRRWGGAAIGIGAGLGFLAKGLVGPGPIAVACALLPVFVSRWRTGTFGRQMAIAALFFLPFAAAWPVALWVRSPALFVEWFWWNNIGRFAGFSVKDLGAETEPGFWLRTFPWFLFPAWIPIAFGAARERRRWLAAPGVQVGMVLAVAFGATLVLAASARVVYALPMLPPLALAGAGAATRLPLRIDRALAIAGLWIGIAASAFAWYAWAMLIAAGHAPDFLARWFPVDYSLAWSWTAVLFALLLCAGFAMLASRAQSPRGLAMWVGGVCVAWGVPMTLLVPWIDHAKSYRRMFEEISAAVPDAHCIASAGLGESERAMMHYAIGMPTLDPVRCDALVRQSFAARPLVEPEGWKLVWTGARPGDARERFELYLRDDARR